MLSLWEKIQMTSVSENNRGICLIPSLLCFNALVCNNMWPVFFFVWCTYPIVGSNKVNWGQMTFWLLPCHKMEIQLRKLHHCVPLEHYSLFDICYLDTQYVSSHIYYTQQDITGSFLTTWILSSPQINCLDNLGLWLFCSVQYSVDCRSWWVSVTFLRIEKIALVDYTDTRMEIDTNTFETLIFKMKRSFSNSYSSNCYWLIVATIICRLKFANISSGFWDNRGL